MPHPAARLAVNIASVTSDPTLLRGAEHHSDPSAQNLRRLLLLRWIAIGGQIFVIGLVHFGLGLRLPIWPMAGIVAALAVWNALSWKRLSDRSGAGSQEVFGQILVDVAALAGLLYFSGGSTNPFVSLFLMPLIIAATLLPPGLSWSTAVITVACYTLLLFEYVPLPLDHDHGSGFSLHVIGMWLNFVLSAGLIAYFVVQMALSIKARDQRLTQARERALRDQQVVALGVIAAGAAHELGTPLSTIAVLARELENESQDPVQREDLRLLRGQVDECKRIIGDLLAAAGRSRAEDGDRQRLDEFVSDVVTRWQDLRPGASLDLRLTGSDPAPMIFAEKTLTQSLVSLLNNAIEASPGGIEVAGAWTGEHLTLEIRDRGRGFDADAFARAGELFFSTKAPRAGRGLGVFLARAAIERLGGRLRLYNRDGGGACTRVEFPLAPLRAGEQA